MASRELLESMGYKVRDPRMFVRAPGTSEELAAILTLQMKGRSTEDIARESGEKQDIVERLVREGKGPISSARRILRVLGVTPLTMPNPKDMS